MIVANKGRRTMRHHTMTGLSTYSLSKCVARALRTFAAATMAVAGLMLAMLAMPASAQQQPSAGPELKQIASDLYFFFEFDGSNAVFLVTDEGVLLIDTRTHPRQGKDLLDRI